MQKKKKNLNRHTVSSVTFFRTVEITRFSGTGNRNFLKTENSITTSTDPLESINSTLLIHSTVYHASSFVRQVLRLSLCELTRAILPFSTPVLPIIIKREPPFYRNEIIYPAIVPQFAVKLSRRPRHHVHYFASQDSPSFFSRSSRRKAEILFRQRRLLCVS